MRLTRKLALLALATATWAVLLCGSSAVAAPVVDVDSLLLYYDFETVDVVSEDEKQFLDGSGNNFHGTINEGTFADGNLVESLVTIEATDLRNGSMSARFSQGTDDLDLPAYVDVHGEDITANFPELLPGGAMGTNAFTLSAWLNVDTNSDGDMSIFQGRTGDAGHGNPHFQLQGDGRFRFVWRTQTGTDVVSQRAYFDGTMDTTNPGELYPVEEWFHFAGTYDDSTAEYKIYFNGENILEGISAEDGTGFGLGDWGGQIDFGEFFAAGFGAVYDSGERRLRGLIDELYVYNQALTAEQVGLLYSVVVPVNADFNDDDAVNGLDFLVWQVGFPLASGATLEDGDADGDGDVDGNDFLIWQEQFAPGNGSGSGAVPEPSTVSLLVLAGLAWAALRKRLN